MAVRTTGPLLNTGPNPAVSAVVLMDNESSRHAVTVKLVLYKVTVSNTAAAKTPIAVQLFTVPANTVVSRAINITGQLAYEITFDVTGCCRRNLVIDSFALTASGELVAADRVLESETTPVSSPVSPPTAR